MGWCRRARGCHRLDHRGSVVGQITHPGQREAVEAEVAGVAPGRRALRLCMARTPLLISLAQARDRMLDAERDLRLLIAYAREFTEPGP